MAAEEQSAPVSGSPGPGQESAGPESGAQGLVEHGFSLRRLQEGRPTAAGQRQEALRKALERLDLHAAQDRKRGLAHAREYIAAGKPAKHATMAGYMEEIYAEARGPVLDPPTLESYGEDPLAGQEVPARVGEPEHLGASAGIDDFAAWEREESWACWPPSGPFPASWGPAEDLEGLPGDLFTETHAEYYAERLARVTAGTPADWFRLFQATANASNTSPGDAHDAANAAAGAEAATATASDGSSNAVNAAGAAGNGDAATAVAGTVVVAGAGVRGFAELDYRSAVEQLAAGKRLAAWLDAGLVRLTHRIGQTAVEELPPREPGTPPASRAGLEELAEQSVVKELACLYRITEKQARGRYETAQELCEHYPGTLAALTAGDLDLEHAGVITRQGDTLPDDAKPGFEAALLGEAPDKTPGELRAAARKQREKCNPETIEVRRERQTKCRSVFLEPADDGMAYLGAYVTAEEAYAAYDRLTQSARGLQTGTETRTAGQLRADVFIELLLNAGMEAGPAAGIRPEVALTVPVFTLMGLDEEPATLDGYGPIPAGAARKLCEGATSFYRILTHPETGTILSYGKTTYRPPADLARAVRHRDTTCTAPGCHVPAKDCDLDHTIDFHGNGGHGRTDFGNLGPRCGSDHRLKSLAGWKVTQTRPGEFTTTTPGNQTYTTKPGDTGAGPPSFTDRVLDALPDNFRRRLKRKKPPPPEPPDEEKEPPF
ncbi:HNH endonuclease signature motif containing protein [Arthrobacter crystallopoietes]|uniref:DUF222 domain-containing protein n=1 Tax=Crystallibacter crystallopoietes TaxID=37928 RepID=A0A1H1B9L2_9MICC|nr:HNH endonuclease signature motif containing protein [Arthrobacter crystallopoietes]AUI51230.1 hypothetical protein AC20117_10845 [Arthrobacter crystallopoietes]SDQ48501.1 protein of unknown function [Arthrobacter crystallopoietes]